MVAGEEGVLLGQGVADVVRGVAGGGDGLQRPAGSPGHLAVGDLDVGAKARLVRLVEPDGAFRVLGRRAADHHCSGPLRQRPSQG